LLKRNPRGAKSVKQADLMAAVPYPVQARQKEGIARLADTTLWYSDTGGNGEAVVFLHPSATGNGKVWGYQQPVLVKAGYRVITYARRGYFKSGKINPRNPGNSSDDLRGLVDVLGLDKFHLVSTASGGSVATDFALSYPDRVFTLALTSNAVGVRKGYIREAKRRLHPKQWNELPRWFREFGPSYIVANPKGIKRFTDLQDEATKHRGFPQRTNFVNSEKSLEKLKMPTLLLTGDADLTSPPSLIQMIAPYIPNCTVVLVPQAGHTPFWEYPRLFNSVLLDFLGRHPPKKTKKAVERNRG
jgi:pimeloyl-ACP methyl ester carboxylesterase